MNFLTTFLGGGGSLSTTQVGMMKDNCPNDIGLPFPKLSPDWL